MSLLKQFLKKCNYQLYYKLLCYKCKNLPYERFISQYRLCVLHIVCKTTEKKNQYDLLLLDRAPPVD